MCGLVGIVGHEPVNQGLYDALTVLSTAARTPPASSRSTASASACTRATGSCATCSSSATCSSCAATSASASAAIRRPGREGSSEAQPFYVNSPYGIALAHNGNLINTDALARSRSRTIAATSTPIRTPKCCSTCSRTSCRSRTPRADARSHLQGGRGAHARCLGGYAVVSLMLGYGVLAFRDPHGIRPLVLGERETGARQGIRGRVRERGARHARLRAACATSRRAKRCSSTIDGKLYSRQCAEPRVHAPCIFEYVYLARPDSMIEDVSVYKARLRMGEKLAREDPARDARITTSTSVIPIPDTVAHRGRCRSRSALGVPVPRRLRQEPLHRPHVHHAGPGASA